MLLSVTKLQSISLARRRARPTPEGQETGSVTHLESSDQILAERWREVILERYHHALVAATSEDHFGGAAAVAQRDDEDDSDQQRSGALGGEVRGHLGGLVLLFRDVPSAIRSRPVIRSSCLSPRSARSTSVCLDLGKATQLLNFVGPVT